MRRILICTEADPRVYRRSLERARLELETSAPVAIVAAACRVAEVLDASAIVSFSKTGKTTLRASQQRPVCPAAGPVAAAADGADGDAVLGRAQHPGAGPELGRRRHGRQGQRGRGSSTGFAAPRRHAGDHRRRPLRRPRPRTNLLRLAVVGENDAEAGRVK